MKEKLSDKKLQVPDLVNRKFVFKESENVSIAFVGDMHLHALTPRSRIDNYADTSIAKLSLLRRELNECGIKYLICSGDVFHVSKERTDYEFRVIQEFKKLKQAGIEVFSIVGNHDVTFDRLDNIDKSSLGILFLTDTVKPFVEIRIEREGKLPIILTGDNYPNDIVIPREDNAYNILVAHRFYQQGDDNAIKKEDLKDYGYNMYLLGHDHIVYDLEKVPTTNGVVSVVRPGSFMRGTSHSYNTSRLVYFDEIRFNGEVQVIRHTLPVKPPKEVFAASDIDKVKTDVSLLSSQLVDLVSQMYADQGSNQSIYSILDRNPVDEKIKGRIVSYLEAAGIFRHESVVAHDV